MAEADTGAAALKLLGGRLCLDMANDGMRCWGTTMGSVHGRGEGMPWDARSWEAAPWFLEKWRWLVGGKDEEISRNSHWWRAMQGLAQA